ncbi:MAG: DUF1707 and DUF2154 domain-containing protein [Nocardioidaceae bacterium]|nr:DUF1707 and DUF2154 domain-containing protein [Nocardioidaceae bacterium]MDQ3325986.1 DUF1707 domain-containing protein [Actinomycetota bacterium]
MSEPPVPEERRRASHADREHVVEQLRVAAGDGRLTFEELEERIDAAYGARTYAELEPLTRDLPANQAPVVQPATERSLATRVTGKPGRRWSVALLGGVDRRSRWRVGSTHSAVAMMGGVDLDLREAELESEQVTIWALAMMGGVDVIVPDDCELDASGFGLLGGFDEHDKAAPPPAGAPVVRVRGLALMGGIDVYRKARTRPDSAGGELTQ